MLINTGKRSLGKQLPPILLLPIATYLKYPFAYTQQFNTFKPLSYLGKAWQEKCIKIRTGGDSQENEKIMKQ